MQVQYVRFFCKQYYFIFIFLPGCCCFLDTQLKITKKAYAPGCAGVDPLSGVSSFLFGPSFYIISILDVCCGRYCADGIQMDNDNADYLDGPSDGFHA